MVILLIGMRDNSCRERIDEALRRIAGVRDVSVSLIRARAVVACDPGVEADVVIDAVRNVGFGVVVEGM